MKKLVLKPIGVPLVLRLGRTVLSWKFHKLSMSTFCRTLRLLHKISLIRHRHGAISCKYTENIDNLALSGGDFAGFYGVCIFGCATYNCRCRRPRKTCKSTLNNLYTCGRRRKNTVSMSGGIPNPKNGLSVNEFCRLSNRFRGIGHVISPNLCTVSFQRCFLSCRLFLLLFSATNIRLLRPAVHNAHSGRLLRWLFQ